MLGAVSWNIHEGRIIDENADSLLAALEELKTAIAYKLRQDNLKAKQG